MRRVTHAPRRSQAERRDEAERRLVESTMAIIAEAGVSAATFDAIGRRAGYSRGLATQHFGSKRGLIDAVVDHSQAEQDIRLEAAHIDEMDGLDAVIAYVRAFCAALRRSTEPKAYFMLLCDAVAEAHETRSAFAGAHAAVKLRLAKLIRKGQARGEISAGVDANSAALMVGSMLLGLSIQSLIDPAMPVAPIERAIEKHIRRSFAPTAGRASHG